MNIWVVGLKHMDIYKNKDFENASDVDEAEILRVTDLRQGVKNPNRVN